jgi:hypothetical protein
MEALASPVIEKITARYGADVHAGNMIFTHHSGTFPGSSVNPVFLHTGLHHLPSGVKIPTPQT